MPAISPSHETSRFESVFQHVVNPQVSHISQLIALSSINLVHSRYDPDLPPRKRSQVARKIFAFTANRATHIEARMAVDG